MMSPAVGEKKMTPRFVEEKKTYIAYNAGGFSQASEQAELLRTCGEKVVLSIKPQTFEQAQQSCAIDEELDLIYIQC